jgi:hypothetical protein
MGWRQPFLLSSLKVGPVTRKSAENAGAAILSISGAFSAVVDTLGSNV